MQAASIPVEEPQMENTTTSASVLKTNDGPETAKVAEDSNNTLVTISNEVLITTLHQETTTPEHRINQGNDIQSTNSDKTPAKLLIEADASRTKTPISTDSPMNSSMISSSSPTTMETNQQCPTSFAVKIKNFNITEQKGKI